MSAQFLHGEAYALKGTHGKLSVEQILDEAMRMPGSCPHVAEPRAPILIFGRPLIDILPLLKSRVADAKDKRGRRLPQTFTTLLCVVVSLPHSPAEVEAEVALQRSTRSFFDMAIGFLKETCGETSVVSVIMHVDEPRLHIHVYIIPEVDPVTNMLTIEQVWPPARAAGDARRAKLTHAQVNEKFREAASALQDMFHARVGALAGLQRIGPGRERLPRAQYLAARDRQARLDAESAARLAAALAEKEREAAARIAAAEVRAAAAIKVAIDAEDSKRRARAAAEVLIQELMNLRAENATLRSQREPAAGEDSETQAKF